MEERDGKRDIQADRDRCVGRVGRTIKVGGIWHGGQLGQAQQRWKDGYRNPEPTT